MYDIILYYENICPIGGIETFLYQIGKIYKNKNLTLMFKSCDLKQLERFKTVYKNIIQYQGQKIKCNTIIINDASGYFMLPQIEAKRYIRIIHNDCLTAKMVEPIIENIDEIIISDIYHLPYNFNKPIEYYGVSKRACIAFYRLTNKQAKLCYNPLELDEKPKKVLHLVSTTRLTPEKGGERMKKLAQMLKDNNIPYIWTIFSDGEIDIEDYDFVLMKPRLDIIDYIADADYLVQLSDYEGCPYVIMEALSVGTPVIATDFYAARELGVNENTGFILDFDMSNVPIQDIYKKEFNFTWTPPKNIWDEILLDKN